MNFRLLHVKCLCAVLLMLCIANFYFSGFDLYDHSELDKKLLKENERNHQFLDLIIDVSPIEQEKVYTEWEMDAQIAIT